MGQGEPPSFLHQLQNICIWNDEWRTSFCSNLSLFHTYIIEFHSVQRRDMHKQISQYERGNVRLEVRWHWSRKSALYPTNSRWKITDELILKILRKNGRRIILILWLVTLSSALVCGTRLIISCLIISHKILKICSSQKKGAMHSVWKSLILQHLRDFFSSFQTIYAI